MRKLIIIILFTSGLMTVKINGQSIDKNIIIQGDWYACGLRSIQINDTVTFYRTDSMCKESDCLIFKWVIGRKVNLNQVCKRVAGIPK